MITFFIKYKLLLSVCVLFTSDILSGSRSSLISAKGMYNHPGETHPITVEAAIGTDFNITCYMNPKTFPRKNSTCLNFVIGRTNEELPWENIFIVNSTTIIYLVHNASEQQTEYRCKCGADAIMETKVFVGSRPRPVNNFSCRSYDFDYMICNFTKPPNPILTTYNVSYYNDFPSYIYQPKCNYDDRSLVVCNISLSDRYQEMYNFIIESRNALVKANEQPLIQHFDINNFEIMIPAKPGDNMRVESLTVDSIKLSWQMTTWEKYRLKGLLWEILLQPENSTVIQRDGPVREHNEMRLRLNNLPYAYWHYKLMIRVRAKSPNTIWSEQFVYTFRTAACRPQRPPLVEPGSFYIDSSETRITIYWEELLPYEYNGDNFTYVITSVRPDGSISDLKPWHMERNLAKFLWRKDLYYEFQIRSRNIVGESEEFSSLIIYPTKQRNPKEFTPQAIHNVYHGNNRTYTLTWSKPKNTTGIISFTVFWCYPKRALPNECKESMYFQQVPADQLNFTTQAQNVSEERILNLAVSANYYKFNTGLHWTDCSMDIVNTDLVKMEPELVVSANSIKVQWSVERVCPSILDGFNITYCEVANDVVAENATCLHNETISKLAKKYDKKYYIKHLKPFTMYKVTMLMFWRTKKGQPSEPQIVRTLEGAPSPPRQLRVEDITNTSATIKWLEPTHPNGNIRKYIIMLNNDQIEVNATTLSYHLENLESFTAYKVYVLAETVERSETSNDVHFTTAIGTPSPPGIGPNNNVANIIQWSKPVKPRGSIEFYEVLVTQLHNDDVLRRRISVITGATACTFSKFPTCIGVEYKTTVEVRAVNVVPIPDKAASNLYRAAANDVYNGNEDLECSASDIKYQESNEIVQKFMNDSLYELYKSPWQTSAIFSCSTSHMSKITTIALVVIAISLGVMAALYMARKKYNKMANINCTLPAGLETYFTKETGAGFPGDFASGSHSMKETRTVEDQWISAARMHDYNFRNEHHHLLASLGNDSGYLGGGNAGEVDLACSINNSDNIHNESKLAGNEEASNISVGKVPFEEDPKESKKENLNDNLKETSISADSLVESSDEADRSNLVLEEPPLTIFPSNNGYIKQSMLQPWQIFHNQDDVISTQLPTSPISSNGYITVQNLQQPRENANKQNEFTTSTGGYVLQQDLQHLFNNKLLGNTTVPTVINPIPTGENGLQINNGGYTTLDDLTKLNMQHNLTARNECHADQQQPNEIPYKNRPNISTDGKPDGISGYVTQHDLNIFAQHQHNY